MKIPVQCASLIGTLLLAVETKPLNRSFIPVSKKHTMFPVVFAVARLNVCVSGLNKKLYPAHDQPPIRACVRRQNSSRSINFAVLASISASRRRISLFQASNAPASSGASRLLTKACANSARSASGSSSASERSLFNISVFINAPSMLCYETG